MRLLVTDFPQKFIRIRNHRRAFIRAHRRNPLHHVRNPARVVNHDFLRLGRAKILKLFQHLIRSPKEQRRLVVRIGKSLSRHNDTPVYLVVRLHKMHVASPHHRLVETFPQLHDFPVDLLQIFFTLNLCDTLAFNHKPVVAKRLYFQIVVEIHNPRNPLLRLLIQ